MLALNHHHCSLYSSKESDWRSLITLSAAQKCAPISLACYVYSKCLKDTKFAFLITIVAHNYYVMTLLCRYSLMMWCWVMEPGNRPSFPDLVHTLSKSLEEMAGYLPIGAFAGLDEENGATTSGNVDHEASTGEAEHTV